MCYIYQLLTHLALDKGQSMALTFSICISPCTQFKCAIYTIFNAIYLILTHLACIANARKKCSILQQFTGRKCVTLFCAVYDVILSIDHVSLTLDGVTSFSCVINIRNTCKRLSYSQTVGGISSVQWQKVEESEGYNCCFIIFSSPEPLGSLVSL